MNPDDIDHLPPPTPFSEALGPLLDELAIAPLVAALQSAVTGPPPPPAPKPGELAWYTDHEEVRAWRYLDAGPDGTSTTVELNYTDGSRDVVRWHDDGRGWRFVDHHYQSLTE